MVDQKFFIEFKRVIDLWGDGAFPEPWLEHASKRTRDLTSEEMSKLCDLLIDNCERAPSIVKVITFASMIRATRNRKPEIHAAQIGCTVCDDLGVIRAKTSKEDLLMNCPNVECKNSDVWNLPRFTYQWSRDVHISKCPADWFRPGAGESHESKAADWKAKIKISSIRWKALGYS